MAGKVHVDRHLGDGAGEKSGITSENGGSRPYAEGNGEKAGRNGLKEAAEKPVGSIILRIPCRGGSFIAVKMCESGRLP